MKIDGKRILITGGSSGIGLALAADLATKGARLLISGRRPEALAAAMERLKPIGARVHSVTADVSTDAGRAKTLAAARDGLGGLDVLINNAGGVRAGRLEETTEAEIRAMVEVDLIAPILLTRAALPQLRQSGDGLVVNVASGIALIGLPFYTTYAAAKAGLARFGEALRRELKGEGIHVLTAYPGTTETPMMSSSQAGPDLGFNREPALAVAAAIVAAIESGNFEVVRGGDARAAMIALNRDDPAALDRRFTSLKPALEQAVSGHKSL